MGRCTCEIVQCAKKCKWQTIISRRNSDAESKVCDFFVGFYEVCVGFYADDWRLSFDIVINIYLVVVMPSISRHNFADSGSQALMQIATLVHSNKHIQRHIVFICSSRALAAKQLVICLIYSQKTQTANTK